MADSSPRKRCIINADDFGFSPAVTEGILRAHRQGVVTSTTLAANMPAADSAVARLAEAPDLGVGVHLNVSQGPPLSDLGRRLAGADGAMNRTATGVIQLVLLRPWAMAWIRAEFDAQIRWALDHGVRPTHLDSHRHAHAGPPIFNCVRELARRYNIRFIRQHGEALPGADWPDAPAKQRRTGWLLNRFGAWNARRAGPLRGTVGTWGIAHTGLIDAAWLVHVAGALGPGVTEIMTHPAAGDDLPPGMTRLRASRLVELAALCDEQVKEAFRQHGVELTHYGRL